ncbi:MAG TPA: hypothetical protein VMB03_16900 [Bryobacteraceae bacterium]|nr:hypothetical protein [Bryobacteraceae bacterium]
MKRSILCAFAVLAIGRGQGGADRSLPRQAPPKVLWQKPPAASDQDWTCTFAGCDKAPVPPFRFIKADKGGTTAKVTIKDGKGRTYSVKFGGKVITECFGSRFLPAAGYTVEPSYLVGPGKIEGIPRLHLVTDFVKRDGRFERARFQLRDSRELTFLPNHAWSLADNPFRGSSQLAGLRVVLMLLSNWDIKDARDGQMASNTGVFRSPDPSRPELLYSFFDWGSTLGRWGGLMGRTRADCSGFFYQTPDFITGVDHGVVKWGYKSKRTKDVTKGITVADLRWLAPYLDAITPAQMRIGLKASGATDRQAACWEGALSGRIHQIDTVARTGKR